jgi:hypothetical protein
MSSPADAEVPSKALAFPPSTKYYSAKSDILKKDPEFVTAMSQTNHIIKSVVNDGAATRNLCRQAIEKNWDAIRDFFKRNMLRIVNCRGNVEAYVDASDDVKLKLNKESKFIFQSFRRVLNFGKVTGATRTVLVVSSPDQMHAFMAMIDEMREMADYKDASSSSTKKSSVAFEGYTGIQKSALFSKKFSEAVADLEETGTWPASIPFDQNISGVVIFDGYCKAFIQAQKSERSYFDGVAVSADALADCTDDIHATVKGHYERVWDDLANNVGGDVDQSKWKAQEANIDRIFHMLFVFFRFKPDLAFSEFNICMRRLEIMKCSFINQNDLMEQCQSSNSKILRGLTFDKKGDGIEKKHRFQHPLMVTAKRFGNGCASSCGIMNTAQVLNIFSNERVAIDTILSYWRIEARMIKAQAKANGKSLAKDPDYFKTRVTYWTLHSFLKGCTSAASWCGDVKGNALQVSFAVGTSAPVKRGTAAAETKVTMDIVKKLMQ